MAPPFFSVNMPYNTMFSARMPNHLHTKSDKVVKSRHPGESRGPGQS